MKHKLLMALGLIVLEMVAFAAIPAMAANPAGTGPYYAMPSWDQTLPASARFVVLSNMKSAAVLDKETGLVWEQSPSTGTFLWEDAQVHCNGLTTGGRLGWRLPTLQELASLVDPSVSPSGPTLPAGHPFSNVFTVGYWSATNSNYDPTSAWEVGFYFGNVFYGAKSTNATQVWCVRGGQGVNPQ